MYEGYKENITSQNGQEMTQTPNPVQPRDTSASAQETAAGTLMDGQTAPAAQDTAAVQTSQASQASQAPQISQASSTSSGGSFRNENSIPGNTYQQPGYRPPYIQGGYGTYGQAGYGQNGYQQSAYQGQGSWNNWNGAAGRGAYTGNAGGQSTYGSSAGQSTYAGASAGQSAYGSASAGSTSGQQVYTGAKKQKEKKPHTFLKKAAIAIACGLIFGTVAGAAVYGVHYVGAKYFPIPSSESSKSEAPAKEQSSTPRIEQTQPVIPEERSLTGKGVQAMDASAIVEDCMPSIVSITNKYVQYYQSFWGIPEQIESEASGSGIIVGENETELLVVTNSHVISDADALTVQFVDGQSYDAQVKGSKDDQDLAIIAVKLEDMSEETLSKIKIATLGDSDSLKVGEPAIAIGNSLGYGQTVTSGIISALERDFTYENTTRQVIQTDAAINPGNSGGALINMMGEVIGINEAKYASTSVEGVGYAIPISTAKPIIDDLVTKTTRSKVAQENAGFLGVAGVDVTQEVSQRYQMPVGVYVAQVTEGSAAETAGIVKGDIITDFDGESVHTMEDLKSTVECYEAGTEVEIKLQRVGDNGYEEKVLRVTLGKREK